MNNVATVELMRTPDQIRLEPFFQKVAHPKDWKAPILAYVRHEDLDVVLEAIQFYTATTATFENLNDGWFRVKSIGYRRGPAGDH